MPTSLQLGFLDHSFTPFRSLTRRRRRPSPLLDLDDQGKRNLAACLIFFPMRLLHSSSFSRGADNARRQRAVPRFALDDLFDGQGTILRFVLIFWGHYVRRHREVFCHVLVVAGIVPVTFRVLPLVYLILFRLLLRGRVH